MRKKDSYFIMVVGSLVGFLILKIEGAIVGVLAAFVISYYLINKK